jgi:hypothetical protein
MSTFSRSSSPIGRERLRFRRRGATQLKPPASVGFASSSIYRGAIISSISGLVHAGTDYVKVIA